MEQELMVMLASAMTKEEIINRIEEAIAEYKEASLLGNEKELHIKSHHLALSCSLWMMNLMTDGDMSKAVTTIEKIGKMRKRDKLFDIDGDKKN